MFYHQHWLQMFLQVDVQVDGSGGSDAGSSDHEDVDLDAVAAEGIAPASTTVTGSDDHESTGTRSSAGGQSLGDNARVSQSPAQFVIQLSEHTDEDTSQHSSPFTKSKQWEDIVHRVTQLMSILL